MRELTDTATNYLREALGDLSANSEINALLKFVKGMRTPRAAGASLTLTRDAHDGDTLLLDTAAGSVVTLPAATGSGMSVRFVVSVMPTSNFHQIKVANANDVMRGSVNNLDADAAAQNAFATASTSDNIQLNGTTKGGQVGDWVELIDIASGVWAVWGQLVTPTGSDDATPFSAAV